VTIGRPLTELEPLLDHVGRRLYPGGGANRMVVASVAFQTVTKHLVGLADGSSGGVPAFGAVRWHVDGRSIRLDDGGSRLTPGVGSSREEVVPALVVRAFSPWVEAVRRHVRIAERLLWAGATASVLYAATRHGGEAVAGAADALGRNVPYGMMATVHPLGARPAFRRLACCLIDRAPGHARCDECPFVSPFTSV
jgi:hypothetical protein